MVKGQFVIKGKYPVFEISGKCYNSFMEIELNNFENKLFTQIKTLINVDNNSFSSLRIGLGVSGGADSTALLIALNSISKKYKNTLTVISVNHFIRSEEETCGDLNFVENLCKKLDSNLEFIPVNLEKGQVQCVSKERGEGIEEAARFLRYSAFEKIIKEKNLDCFCLAHNREDNFETIVMRFLQGSGLEGGRGIYSKRDKFIRPMLGIGRKEIEEYLTEKNITWRTDKTNFDTQYLRNKIRHKLLPFLNENFEGWQTALENGKDKTSWDFELISKIVEEKSARLIQKRDNEFFVGRDIFSLEEKAIQSRIIIKMCNLVSEESRIPFIFIKEILALVEAKKSAVKVYKNIEIKLNNEEVLVKKNFKNQTDLCFFDIIEENGDYDFPFGSLKVQDLENGLIRLLNNGQEIQLKLSFPFCVRNISAEDFVRTKEGSFRKVLDVFSDWKVGEEKKLYIPLIQELKTKEQEIVCIFGSALGFYNWVVNEKVSK